MDNAAHSQTRLNADIHVGQSSGYLTQRKTERRKKQQRARSNALRDIYKQVCGCFGSGEKGWWEEQNANNSSSNR